MAEVLGIIASGMAVGQLAVSITSSIIKLKEYWDQVKDAPGEILQLLLEIDSLNLILSHIEQDGNRAGILTSQNVCLGQSLNLCKQGTEELSVLVSELAEKIDGKKGWRRKAGASRVVLKRGEIKRVKRRMKNAIRLLSLSYQCHTNAMIRLQPDIIVARISDKMNSMSEAIASGFDISHTNPEHQDITNMTKEEASAAENCILISAVYHVRISSPSKIQALVGSLQYWYRYETSKGRHTLEANARYRCPSWLSNRDWDARYFSEVSTWKFHLQTHPVLPRNHDIFVFANTGNITGLQNMLVQSPSYVAARQEFAGRTPLHVAASQGQLEVCKLLLDAGADSSAEDDHGFTIIHGAGQFKPKKAGDDSMIIDLTRILINAGAFDSTPLYRQMKEASGYCYPDFDWYYGLPSLFQFLQHQMYPSWNGTPLEVRLEIIKGIIFWQHESARDIFRLALGGANIKKEMLATNDYNGWTILHWIGLALSERKFRGLKLCHISGQSVSYLHRHTLCHNGNYGSWSAFLRDVLSAGSLLHAADDEGRTPLCVLLIWFRDLPKQTEYWNRDAKMIQYLSCILYTWIYELKVSGVDLEQYGKMESALGLKDKVNSSRRSSHREEKFHILGFSYGPTVEDWKVWFSEPTDYLAGKFWAMIEKSPSHSHSRYTIPGSWQKDIELSESDSESN